MKSLHPSTRIEPAPGAIRLQSITTVPTVLYNDIARIRDNSVKAVHIEYLGNELGNKKESAAWKAAKRRPQPHGAVATVTAPIFFQNKNSAGRKK
jgi:hypothetical protein